MSVDVEISSIFGRYTDGVLNTKVEGKTVRECLHDLVKQFPKLKKMLLDKSGNLMHSYDFFINGQSVYPKDMNLPLKDGDKLNVLYVIHGG
ncbi:MAG: MoaD/ThiS family protein [Dehalococcoidales bacterium]